MNSWTTVVSMFLFLLPILVTGQHPDNVAFKKPTRQKDTLATSSRAVDGSLSASWSDNTCSSTMSLTDNWWVVDLLFNYNIFFLQIVNRRSNYQKLQNFSIYASEYLPLPIPLWNGALDGELCLNYPGIFPPGGPHKLQCNRPIRGRYVYVWKPDHNELSICEFQVIVPDTQREMTCHLVHWFKSPLTPVYEEVMTLPTLTQCMHICMTFPERTPTHIQINKTSGKCGCIQFSELMESSSDEMTPDGDFDLCALNNMFSYSPVW